jgi:hypothetical protein
MSPGNESIPSPGAALFGFDIKSTAEKKNHPLTKAGKTNKVRRTNYASISRVTQDPVFCYNETCDTTKLFPPHPFFMSASNFYSYLLIPLDVQSTFCSIKCVFSRIIFFFNDLILFIRLISMFLLDAYMFWVIKKPSTSSTVNQNQMSTTALILDDMRS